MSDKILRYLFLRKYKYKIHGRPRTFVYGRGGVKLIFKKGILFYTLYL